MHPIIRFISIVAVLLLCGSSLAARVAHAVPQFKKQFEIMYVRSDSDQPHERSLAEGVLRAQCNTCHLPANKKQRNVYGRALAQYLKKTDKDDVEKIRDALARVAAMQCDPDDEASPTFGELISQGKLPGSGVKESAPAAADEPLD